MAPSSPGDATRRTIEQDDINGFWRAFGGSPRVASNKSFEHGSVHWDRKPATGGGSSVDITYMTNGNTPWGTDYFRLDNDCGSCGNNVSIRQHIRFDGPPGGTATAQAHVRGPDGGGSAAIVVWDLNTGIPYIGTCNVPTSGGWAVCNRPVILGNQFEVYVEVYNFHPTLRLDVDMVDLYL
jgi:hypothetical protein